MTPKEIVAEMMHTDYFSQWMKLEVLAVDKDYSKVQMEVKREMLNGFGILHGGVAYAMADSAFAFASNSRGVLTVSIEGSMHYFKSAREGSILVAETKPLKTGRNVSHYEVEVTVEGELFYKFKGIVYHTDKEYPLSIDQKNK